jgi:hypothetical protein
MLPYKRHNQTLKYLYAPDSFCLGLTARVKYCSAGSDTLVDQDCGRADVENQQNTTKGPLRTKTTSRVDTAQIACVPPHTWHAMAHQK